MSLETVAQVCDDHTVDVARIDAGMISSGRCRRFDLFSDPAPSVRRLKWNTFCELGIAMMPKIAGLLSARTDSVEGT